MYIDYIKDSYPEKNPDVREKFIARDKKHLASVIQDRITSDVENIVGRWYELDDIGLIEKDEAFLELLRESEELYSFGYFIGSISLIGVATEEFSKYLFPKNNLVDDDINQVHRIKKLYDAKIITREIKDKLHKIRLIRNTYIHFNKNNQYSNKEKIKNQAFQVIKYFKSILKSILDTTEEMDLDLVDKFVSKQQISFDEFKYRNRNMDKKTKGIDLQISPGKAQSISTSYYYIYEVDLDGEEFKELTLIDLNFSIYIPIIVDLTLPQAEHFKELKLKESNVILATIISAISSMGQTEEWLLLNIHDVYRGIYKLQ